jgi:hypothetical protein
MAEHTWSQQHYRWWKDYHAGEFCQDSFIVFTDKDGAVAQDAERRHSPCEQG